MKNKLLLLSIILFLSLNINIFAQEESIQEPPVREEQAPEQEKPKPSLGLSVQPGGMMLQYVKLGQTYDLYEKSGVALIIENKDNNPHTYRINTYKPSQVGNKRWLKGYSEIPDSSWFYFENDEVTVEPQSKQQVKMFLNIPDEDRYYNQNWTVALGVSGKAEAGQMLALAVYPRYQIETESKAGLEQIPDGLIGLQPSKLHFKNLALGNKDRAKVIIYNNDTQIHRYRITPKVIEVNPAREQIVVSPGYSWLPDKRWVKPSKSKLSIKPGEAKELTVTVSIPERKEYSRKKWEALLFVEPKEALPGFVRVQIQTE